MFVRSLYEFEICVKRYTWLLNFSTDFSEELETEFDFDVIYVQIAQYSERLQEIFEIHLSRQLEKNEDDEIDEISINLLLKLCQEFNKINLFEASFKLSIIYPTLDSIFSLNSLNFQQFIDQILKFIFKLKNRWNLIINHHFYFEEYKFWVRTVLTPILSWIIEKWNNIFIPIPINLEEFKGNFEKGIEFIKSLEEEFFIYEDEIIFFRSQNGWINFMKKWALHQYYQMIIKKIILPIEEKLNSEDHNLKGPESRSRSISTSTSTSTLSLSLSLFIINSLKKLWSDEIILKPLIPKYLKITLQVFRRFINSCSKETLIHYRNPKVFFLNLIQKQFNLKEFNNLIENNLKEQFKKRLNQLTEEDLSEIILKTLKEETNISLKETNDFIIIRIEELYENVEILDLSLETLKLLKLSNIQVSYDLEQLIQGILLKFNRKIFKLIDEKGIKPEEYPKIIEKMKFIEGEVIELGHEKLIKEEFWLEIKAAL